MYEVYNPYNINYGSTIVQNIMFYDSNSRVSKQYGSGDNINSKRITPDQYFMELGYKELKLSLSTNEEMDYRPIKDNCIIDLSLEQKSNMSQVQIDYYYEQEKNRCFDSFKYAQNKTFQFISFLRVAYDKFTTLFGTNYNYLVKFNDKWLNVETGLIYNELINNGKENVYFVGYHIRDINDYYGSIVDNYYIDMSYFFNTIDLYSISEINYGKLLNEQISRKFNLYPQNIEINPQTSQPYYTVTNLQHLYYQKFHTAAKIYENQTNFIQEFYIDSYNDYGERIIEITKTFVSKTNNLYSIEPQYPNYVFYSDCGLVMYVLEPLTFDLDTKIETIDYIYYYYIKHTYSYEVSNVYFKLKFFALPEFQGFANAPNSATGDFGFLQDFKDKPILKKCCLLNCMKKQK